MTGSIAASFRRPSGDRAALPADTPPADRARRELLTGLAVGVGLTTLLGGAVGARAAAPAASRLTPLQESDPAAQATRYVSDARRAKSAEPGASCSSCSLYGSLSANQGTCSLFPSNLVAAGGWCSGWSSL